MRAFGRNLFILDSILIFRPHSLSVSQWKEAKDHRYVGENVGGTAQGFTFITGLRVAGEAESEKCYSEYYRECFTRRP